jgi:hypothetical protein
MQKIAIISHVDQMDGGMNILFPIFRWRNQLQEEQLKFDIFKNHNDNRILNYKAVIILHRYFQILFKKGIFADYEPIKEYLHKLKSNGTKIIYFDTGDGTSTNSFVLMDYVDLFLKKQLLKEKKKYLINEGDKSVRTWITNYDETSKNKYYPCKKEHLDKIGLAWNIGLVDYRFNPFRLGIVSNRFFTRLKIAKPSFNRSILTSFRGNINKDNTYSFQRNRLIQFLTDSDYHVINANPVNRKKYLKELEQCKAIVSPFGWGEICYRDFEAFIKGAILIKPDMSHLETFPDFFREQKTYIPVNWQVTNLEEKLQLVNDNYKELIEIAIQGQENFMKLYNDGEMFVDHLSRLLKP